MELNKNVLNFLLESTADCACSYCLKNDTCDCANSGHIVCTYQKMLYDISNALKKMEGS